MGKTEHKTRPSHTVISFRAMPFVLAWPCFGFASDAQAAETSGLGGIQGMDGFRLTATGFEYQPVVATIRPVETAATSALPRPALTPPRARLAVPMAASAAEAAAGAGMPETIPIVQPGFAGTGKGTPPSLDRARQKDGLTLAVGVMTVPSYNGSDTNVLSPAFAVRGRVNGYSFSSRGTSLSVDLVREWRGDNWDVKFGPVINMRGDRSGGIKDVQVRALGKLGRAIEAGAFFGVSRTGVITSKHDQLGMRIAVVRDVLGKHSSMVIAPSVEYGTPLSKTTFVGVQASASIVGKKFGRYYYNVTPAGAAASGLSPYTAAGDRSGLARYTVGAAVAQSLSGDLRKGWTVLGGVQYSRLQGRYARSPIVADAGKRSGITAGLGLAYQF